MMFYYNVKHLDSVSLEKLCIFWVQLNGFKKVLLKYFTCLQFLRLFPWHF